MSTAEQPAWPTDEPVPFVVFGDFICPWSYAALDVVERVATEYGLEPQWRAHMLHPEVPPEGIPFPEDRKEETVAWLAETAPEASQSMRFPDRIQFSFRAFEALEYARDRGADIALARAVFHALWQEGQDIASVETLQGAASSAGLDAGDLGRALQRGQYVERAFGAVHQARRLGITATPTFILGRTRINGWHYFEVLQSVLEQQGIAPRN